MIFRIRNALGRWYFFDSLGESPDSYSHYFRDWPEGATCKMNAGTTVAHALAPAESFASTTVSNDLEANLCQRLSIL